MKNNMIKRGVWIANKRGTYIIVNMEDRFIQIKDVLKDKKGNILYGKTRFIGVDDLDNYELV